MRDYEINGSGVQDPVAAAAIRVAARLQRSRRLRRENKDIVQKNERLVKFFEDQKNRETLNRMRQLLGQQRKEEEFLKSKRIYKPRVEV